MVRRRWYAHATLSILIFLPSAPLRASLAAFVDQPDAAYKYETDTSWQGEGVAFTSLQLSSQRFRDQIWRHLLTIAKPAQWQQRDQVILLIGGGRSDKLPGEPKKPGKDQIEQLQALATGSHMLAALIEQIPAQPLFGNKLEDAIIAYTIGEFFRSGDASWPLLQPMVKSVVRAMDTVQAYAAHTWQEHVRGFVLSGESKRGWTTWLTAAIDKRVSGLVPLVFDMLNMPLQLAHQVAVWGAFSEQLGDYHGLPEMLASPRGKELLAMIDPVSYKHALLQPKFIALGTNDRYWPIDAANLYFPQLPGLKYLLYVANANHDTTANLDVRNARIALALAASGQVRLPQVESSFVTQAASGAGHLLMHLDLLPVAVTWWQATAPTQDFRTAYWAAQAQLPASLTPGIVIKPLSGQYSANYLNVRFSLHGHDFAVTSAIGILAPAGA